MSKHRPIVSISAISAVLLLCVGVKGQSENWNDAPSAVWSMPITMIRPSGDRVENAWASWDTDAATDEVQPSQHWTALDRRLFLGHELLQGRNLDAVRRFAHEKCEFDGFLIECFQRRLMSDDLFLYFQRPMVLAEIIFRQTTSALRCESNGDGDCARPYAVLDPPEFDSINAGRYHWFTHTAPDVAFALQSENAVANGAKYYPLLARLAKSTDPIECDDDAEFGIVSTCGVFRRFVFHGGEAIGYCGRMILPSESFPENCELLAVKVGSQVWLSVVTAAFVLDGMGDGGNWECTITPSRTPDRKLLDAFAGTLARGLIEGSLQRSGPRRRGTYLFSGRNTELALGTLARNLPTFANISVGFRVEFEPDEISVMPIVELSTVSERHITSSDPGNAPTPRERDAIFRRLNALFATNLASALGGGHSEVYCDPTFIPT